MTIKPGDLVRFKATGRVCIYLGMIDECYAFHCNEFGRVELSKNFSPVKSLEVVYEQER
jgi:hypothetical protein